MYETLRPGVNIVMILVSGTLTLVMTVMTTPRPWQMTVLGSLLGLVLGIMQSKGLHEANESMRDAKTAMEVRSQLKQTKWGRKYLFALWISAAVLLASWFTTSMKSLPFLAGYFALMFARDLLTLRVTFQQNRLPDKAA